MIVRSDGLGASRALKEFFTPFQLAIARILARNHVALSFSPAPTVFTTRLAVILPSKRPESSFH